MNCNVTVSERFLKDLKRLAKRYKSIKEDAKRLGEELRENPLLGVDLGHNLRKVRMAIASKGKGKRGGARVITYSVTATDTNYEIKLLTIYDKSEQATMTPKELDELVSECGLSR